MIKVRKAETIADFNYVESVFDDPEMWERSKDDYTKKEDFTATSKNVMWIIMEVEGKKSGLVSVNAESNTVLNIHVHIPIDGRGRNTKKLGEAVLKWIKINSVEQYQKLNTKIPVIYKDVIRYAHSLGFKDEGIDRLSIMKNGILIDRLNLGMTFGDIKA